MRRKWVTSAETCERAVCAHCNPKPFSSSHGSMGQLAVPHTGWLAQGLLGMIYVLITATALDTALCLTGVSPKASAPAQGHQFTPVYSQRKASVLPRGCRGVKSWGLCCCTIISYINGSYITDYCQSFTPDTVGPQSCTSSASPCSLSVLM